ncbi:MAG: hypothetical protein V2A79_11500 [Planctomycetota bacterium]
MLWFKLLKVIHAALPVPQAELAAANGPEEYRAAIAAAADGQLERGKRRQIFIEIFGARFEPDLDNPEVVKGFEDLSGETAAKEIKGEKRPGFLVQLTCRTPNEGRVKFVTEAFKDKLQELGRVPNQGFYINRIWLTKGKVLGSSMPSSGEQPPTGPRGGRRPPGRRPSGSTPPPPPEAKDKEQAVLLPDPITGEPTNDDWEFELVFDVVLEDLPASAPEQTPDKGEKDQDRGGGE